VRFANGRNDRPRCSIVGGRRRSALGRLRWLRLLRRRSAESAEHQFIRRAENGGKSTNGRSNNARRMTGSSPQRAFVLSPKQTCLDPQALTSDRYFLASAFCFNLRQNSKSTRFRPCPEYLPQNIRGCYAPRSKKCFCRPGDHGVPLLPSLHH